MIFPFSLLTILVRQSRVRTRSKSRWIASNGTAGTVRPGRKKAGRWNGQSSDAEKDQHERSFRASGEIYGYQKFPLNEPEINSSFSIFEPPVAYFQKPFWCYRPKMQYVYVCLFCCLGSQNSLSLSFSQDKISLYRKKSDLTNLIAVEKTIASFQHKRGRKNYLDKILSWQIRNTDSSDFLYKRHALYHAN